MHQPRPHGSFGADLTEEDAAAAEALLRQVSNLKEQSGLPSLKLTRALPGGGSVTALDMGGVVKTFATRAPHQSDDDPEEDANPSLRVPMLFCGLVRNAIVRPPEGVLIEPTAQCLRRLGGYKASAPGAALELQRFVVRYSTTHSELAPKTEGAAIFTQYVGLRPSWYSGSMAALVQIVGGYGRQDFKELPDTPTERAQMRLPEKVLRKAVRELGKKLLPGYSGAPPRSGQIQYDYKHAQTHGVSFDKNDKPWLVRISPAGVYVMPLPMVPLTTTDAFAEYVREVGDSELQWVLDRFGGLPSGEGFPDAKGFEAWRRAGVVIKACDAADFYKHICYYPGCGWSFNTRGTEAFNTCYSHGQDGLQRGYAYKLTLRLSALRPDDEHASSWAALDEHDRSLLGQYLATVTGALGPGVQAAAAKYKIQRSTPSDLLARAHKPSATGAGEAQYWIDLEMGPIADHTCEMVRVAEGTLWAPGPARAHPQIKFPDPAAGGCVSHDFSAEQGPAYAPEPEPRCDTIMFGYHADDELKVVKYFHDPREKPPEVVSDYEPCMTVGSWSRFETLRPSRVLGAFYTSDFDDREDTAAITEETKIVGRDLGYATPFFAFDAPFWKPGMIWRNRYFTHHASTKRSEGLSLKAGVCVPYLHRCASLYTTSRTSTSAEVSESLTLLHIRDPYSYRYWTYDSVVHWAGSLPVMTGVPYPKDGSPVWVEMQEYNPSECSDFADQGPWIPNLPADYTWLVHPQANVWYMNGGGPAPTVEEYHKTTPVKSKLIEGLQMSLPSAARKIGDKPDPWYFTISPDRFGNVFYRDAIEIAAGSATYASCSEPDPHAPRQRMRWGFTRLADHKTAHIFIGVINE